MDSQRFRHFGVVEKYKDADIKMPVRSTKLSAWYDAFCAEAVVVPSLIHNIFELYTSDSEKSKRALRAIQEIRALGGICMLESKELVNDKVYRGFLKHFLPTPVHSGVKVHMKENDLVHCANRSGNPSTVGLVLANGLGFIDADYVDKDGEIIFQYYNLLPYDILIEKGDKIGQLIFTEYKKSIPDLCQESERNGGFNSTGF